MEFHIKNYFYKFLKQSRNVKRLIVVINDGLIILSNLVLISLLFYQDFSYQYIIFPTFTFFVILFLNYIKVYNNVVRFISINLVFKLSYALFIPYFLASIFSYFFDIILTKIFFVSFFFSIGLIFISRFTARALLNDLGRDGNKNVAILLDQDYLNHSDSRSVLNVIDNEDYRVVSILTNKIDLSGLILNDITVDYIDNLKKLIEDKNVKTLFIPSKLNGKEIRDKIYNYISDYPLKVVEIPDLSDLVTGKNNLNILKNFSIEDIASRSKFDTIKVPTNFFSGKTVLITGGGGSIGSVLSEEVAAKDPQKLILFDNSEIALFNIKNKLEKFYKNINLEFHLIDLKDEDLVSSFFKNNKIDFVYHAAAYKHVGLVEKNILSSVKNNINGFINVVNGVKNNDVKYLTLISTDKAASPTTIMGMTKRICEKILINEFNKNNNLVFSAVRFGNVFDSSGSVISIFKKQILNKENLTVTSEDVTRYFMSIKEAANLVIKSSSLANGGELFILDMGEPIKIIDIARKMIHLSGNTIKSKSNPSGDIEIEITGLLDSEKMHEELSISELRSTDDNKIFLSKDLAKINENFENDMEYLLSLENENEIIAQIKKVCLD